MNQCHCTGPQKNFFVTEGLEARMRHSNWGADMLARGRTTQGIVLVGRQMPFLVQTQHRRRRIRECTINQTVSFFAWQQKDDRAPNGARSFGYCRFSDASFCSGRPLDRPTRYLKVRLPGYCLSPSGCRHNPRRRRIASCCCPKAFPSTGCFRWPWHSS